MVIKILGTGCSKCKTTVSNAEEAVRQTALDAAIIKVEDIQVILAYNVLSTLVFVIDEGRKLMSELAS